MSAKVNKTDPITITIEVAQGDNKIGAKTVIDWSGWPGLSPVEREQAFANAFGEVVFTLRQQLEFE